MTGIIIKPVTLTDVMETINEATAETPVPSSVGMAQLGDTLELTDENKLEVKSIDSSKVAGLDEILELLMEKVGYESIRRIG